MQKVKSFLKSWEFFLILLLVVMCAVFKVADSVNVASGVSRKSVFYFANVLRSMRPYFLYSFMTLGMMLILAMGDIDISVGAIGTLSVVTLGVVYNKLAGGAEEGSPMALVAALAVCLLVGALCGALNGFLVTRFKELFPMIITLATQLFFRGFSYLLIGGETLTFKDPTFKSLSNLNQLLKIGELQIPISIPIYLALAVVFYIWLHQTGNGRKIFAIGTNSAATYYSGVRVDRIKFWCFVIAGFMSAVTGIFFVGNSSSSVKADIMDGYHMYAIAAAVLGGFSTDGGKGSVIGATISLVIFGVVKFGLGNIFSFPDSAVNLSVGVILILSVLGPNLLEDAQNRRKVRLRRAETAKLNAAKAA
ncbi:MAG: ABC transporter permease [Clostridia bacterium]|nr:ABC transporter permease [Clostridia bacterium]